MFNVGALLFTLAMSQPSLGLASAEAKTDSLTIPVSLQETLPNGLVVFAVNGLYAGGTWEELVEESSRRRQANVVSLVLGSSNRTALEPMIRRLHSRILEGLRERIGRGQLRSMPFDGVELSVEVVSLIVGGGRPGDRPSATWDLSVDLSSKVLIGLSSGEVLQRQEIVVARSREPKGAHITPKELIDGTVDRVYDMLSKLER